MDVKGFNCIPLQTDTKLNTELRGSERWLKKSARWAKEKDSKSERARIKVVVQLLEPKIDGESNGRRIINGVIKQK